MADRRALFYVMDSGMVFAFARFPFLRITRRRLLGFSLSTRRRLLGFSLSGSCVFETIHTNKLCG